MSSKKVICPASDFGLDGIYAHYSTAKELKLNKGVCADCAAKFKRQHAKTDRRIKAQSDARRPIHGNKFTFNALTSDLEEGYHLNFISTSENLSIDGEQAILEQEPENESKHLAAEAVKKILLKLHDSEKSPLGFWASFNALLCAAQIHPQMETHTEKEIGEQVFLNKAVFSLRVNYWRDLLGLATGANGTSGAASFLGRRNSRLAAIRRAGKSFEAHYYRNIANALDRAVREINRTPEVLEEMTSVQLMATVDRLRPLVKLYERLKVRVELK
jgi:hypothetical protein